MEETYLRGYQAGETVCDCAGWEEWADERKVRRYGVHYFGLPWHRRQIQWHSVGFPQPQYSMDGTVTRILQWGVDQVSLCDGAKPFHFMWAFCLVSFCFPPWSSIHPPVRDILVQLSIQLNEIPSQSLIFSFFWLRLCLCSLFKNLISCCFLPLIFPLPLHVYLRCRSLSLPLPTADARVDWLEVVSGVRSGGLALSCLVSLCLSGLQSGRDKASSVSRPTHALIFITAVLEHGEKSGIEVKRGSVDWKESDRTKEAEQEIYKKHFNRKIALAMIEERLKMRKLKEMESGCTDAAQEYGICACLLNNILPYWCPVW